MSPLLVPAIILLKPMSDSHITELKALNVARRTHWDQFGGDVPRQGILKDLFDNIQVATSRVSHLPEVDTSIHAPTNKPV